MAQLDGTVDISQKDVSYRRALAESTLEAPSEVIEAIKGDGLPKPNPLATARAAGMLAAKQTPGLIPHCHPVALTDIRLDFQFSDHSVTVTCEVAACDRTGPEIEAMCGASVATLTLYDMIKGICRVAKITETRLIEKEGGKSGHWHSGEPNG